MDLSIIKSILLGILQGLTEFLPVSSSGHVMLLSEVLGTDLEGGVLSAFTIMLHVGTLMAVLIFYMNKVIDMLRHPVKGELKWLIVATLPTVVYALILKKTGWDDVVDASARTLLPFAFLFTAVLLLFCDAFAKARKKARTSHGDVRFGNALAMGLMQCLGTFSGVSRSGSTITGGLASGLNTKAAADFSFMMSMPAILGAAVLDLMGGGAEFAALSECMPQLLAGVLAAFVFGLLAIKLMLAAIKKMRLKWFSLYLVIIAAVVIVNDYIAKIW